MKHWNALAASAVLGLASMTTQADTLGVFAGYSHWSAEGDGEIAAGKQASGRFNYADEGQSSYFVAVEHPVPFVPNLRIQHNELAVSGRGNASGFSFAGNTYNGSVRNDLDLSSTDFVLYYELVDTFIDIDLGVNLKYIDGHAQVSDAGQSSRVSLSAPVPMLYGAVQAGLPLTGLSARGQFNVLSVGENQVSDYQAELQYALIDNLAVDLSAVAGYRRMELDLDDVDNFSSDLTFTGPYLGLNLHF